MTTTATVPDARRIEWFASTLEALGSNLAPALRGKQAVVRLALLALVAEGHLLIEDVPGVGKTSLARGLAESIDATWHRIQFTPDLLPSDVTGVSVWDQREARFRFQHGPVFANVVVADEINRASPRTQSALLEVMEEHQVTVDGTAHPVPRPFLVIATQNPIELEGTHRLPEAQLDRFLMRVTIGYPDPDAEVALLTERRGTAVPRLQPVITADDVATLVAVADEVYVAPAVVGYVARLLDATRRDPALRLGASPRAGLALLRAARAAAAADGLGYVTPEHVKAMAAAVLPHRLLLTPPAERAGATTEAVLADVLASVPVPRRSA